MRVTVGLAAAGIALSGCASAEDVRQAYLGVFVETSVMKIAGMKMPEMPRLPEGVQLPAGMKLPPMPGAPERKLTVRLWSPGPAPDTATATLTVPDSVKIGPQLKLAIARPAEIKASMERVPPGETKMDVPDFTIKMYWGSSPAVREGQPEVIRFDALSEEQKAAMRAARERAGSAASLYYKPDWTTAYWPGPRERPTLAEDSLLAGTYALASTYTGAVDLPVPPTVRVLAPIELTAPDLGEKVGLDDAIRFQWNAVPGILGYHARIVGMMGKTTLILWDSSEIKERRDLAWDFLQMSEVAELVKAKAAMGPAVVTMTVPAAIFKGCDMVMLTMIGYGPGAATAAGNPLPRLQTKTTLSVMLGGARMPRMPAPGADGG